MNSDPAPKRTKSEMISEMAVQIVSVGKTPEEKQSRLTAACPGHRSMGPGLRAQRDWRPGDVRFRRRGAGL